MHVIITTNFFFIKYDLKYFILSVKRQERKKEEEESERKWKCSRTS